MKSEAAALRVEDLLDQTELPGQAGAALRRLGRTGVGVAVASLLLLGAWAVSAPLSGAVVATGLVKTEHNRKVIQHQEGGIVSSILVRDGQVVKAGDVLAVIGDVRSDAGLDLLRDQHDAELIRRTRLEAEVDFAADFSLSAELRKSRVVGDILPRERKVFQARRSTLNEQVTALGAQIHEADTQIEALGSQIKSTDNGLKLAQEELVLNEKLVEQGYVQKTRLMTLQRGVEDYQGRLGQQRSDLAQANQRIQDLRLRIAQARNAYQQQAADDLKDATVRLREMDEKLRPSSDLADRQTVKAPVAGTIMAMHITAVGTSVGPREPLMELIPLDEKLVVEAHIRPEDIDHVRVGGKGEVRISAYDTRSSPHLAARIEMVSADRVFEQQSGTSWYVAQLSVDDAALKQFPHLVLQAGMPAEVFVATTARTLVDYLMEPIDAFRQRALREP
ncbi:MAG: HlyD family type I secretion periplasmic adaptor subunit [Leptothrix sp. (in: b-proteobacteria)]